MSQKVEKSEKRFRVRKKVLGLNRSDLDRLIDQRVHIRSQDGKLQATGLRSKGKKREGAQRYCRLARAR